jgi:serine O-acetyltransferase
LIIECLRRRITRYLVVVRLGAWARTSRRRLPVHVTCRWLHRRWSQRYGLEIPYAVQIGPGLRILHLAGGVVVHPSAVIGRNCTLGQGITIGGADGRAAARVGDDVNLGAGSRLIGDVHVGNGAIVLANAVVTHDGAAGAVVGGIPAKPVDASRSIPIRHADYERLLGVEPTW